MSDRTRKDVFVRAKTSDGRWATVDVLDLDERSFRAFAMNVLAGADLVTALDSMEELELSTDLTKKQADALL